MKATFKLNLANPEVYTIQTTVIFQFTYCRVSRPRDDWMIRQGVTWVFESWVHHQKTVFTCLRPTSTPGHNKWKILIEAVKCYFKIDYEPGDPITSILNQRSYKPVKSVLK